MFKSRIKKHIATAMQYFWAAFFLQLLVYALLSHVVIRHWSDVDIRYLGIGGILLFVPFTYVMMQKFKSIAITKKPADGSYSVTTIREHVQKQQSLLQGFYNFKQRYERILIPLSSAIGVLLTFKLYVPGSLQEHTIAVTVTYLLTLLSCIVAIRAENRKNFVGPLHQLNEVLGEFEHREY
jgi:hypothetical protein